MAPLDLSISGTTSICHAPDSRSNSLRGAGYAEPSGRRSMESDKNGALFEEMSPSRGKSMVRAKDWTPAVEDMYRLQFCGWRDEEEYRVAYGEPERWSTDLGGFISKVQLKSNGYFTYWRKWRECEEKHVSRVKIYK